MLEGGCLCGAVRYRVDGQPVDTGYCHCSLCRRSTGAPAVPWITFPAVAFRYTGAAPRVHQSSSWGQRAFCGNCGTQLVYRRRERARTVDITIMSLDEPEAWPPQYHIFVADRVRWFDTSDDLPRYEDSGPDVD